MGNPYVGQPPERRWRSGVAQQRPGEIKGLYSPRFEIPKDGAVATAGSCFAQHIARNLNRRGWAVLDVEPKPRGMPEKEAKSFQYGLYSARYGNIYTARQLRELADEALNGPVREIIWEKGGRYYDAFRPNVEPDGLESPEEVIAHRRDHVGRVRKLLETADYWVFTFGLTEAWTDGDHVYPTAPGVIAGEYDPDIYRLKNFDVLEVIEDFEAFRNMVRKVRPDPRFLITVSPVPLAATATDQHVLPATMYSKSVLRAAAGMLYDRHGDIDYFPSYELISTPFAKGIWFEDDWRNVRPDGVEMVMRNFFADYSDAPLVEVRDVETDVVCEEALLEAFS
jgi:hypothetical protein